MWSDIETSKDLLGYSVHASLIKDVVTNEKNLPITVGLYGDWGCGKSSILKILEEQLKLDEDCVVIYFESWTFENFDDAKIALIQGIVDKLEAEERFFAKVGDVASESYKNLKDAFSELRKSLSWMRVLKFATNTVVPIATSAMTGGASLIPLLLEAFNNNKDNHDKLLTGDHAEAFLKNILHQDEEKKYEAVREFRKHFEELIQKSKQGKIVILIDDLDRCLPRHIIDSLEAIKLFLNVHNTAFVIAADKFIVSNAIRSEYKAIIDAAQEDDTRRNIGDSYMEKFIQLPYHIPALSRKEVETYVTLLFCQSVLSTEMFDGVQADFVKFVQQNKFEIYAWENIQKALKDGDESEQQELRETIGFVTHFSNIIGKSLRWNPRLIKRFLNAYEIRSNLLAMSDIHDPKSKFALLKLMLIEQQYMPQFKQLNSWVMNSVATSQELIEIEKYAQVREGVELEYKEWDKPELLEILVTEPLFSSIDMKELFWVSRDNIIDEMSGISLIPPRITSLFKKVFEAPSDKIREGIVKRDIVPMSTDDLNDFYNLIDAQIITNPQLKEGYSIYMLLDQEKIESAYTRLVEIISQIDVNQIPFSLGRKFHAVLSRHKNDNKLYELLTSNKRLIRTIESIK